MISLFPEHRLYIEPFGGWQSPFETIERFDRPDTLFYVEPFGWELTEEQHQALSELLHSCQGKVLLAGSPSGLYCKLYRDWDYIESPILADGCAGANDDKCLWVKPLMAIEKADGCASSPITYYEVAGLSVSGRPLATVLLPITSLKLDRRLQMRHELNPLTVANYLARLENSEPPPIDVYLIDGCYYPVNGFHRIETFMQAGREGIGAIVTLGTFEDALLAACAANVDHGLPPQNSERRKAVKTYLLTLEELPAIDARKSQSLRDIASRLGVSHTTVDNVQKEIANERAIAARDLKAGTRVSIDGQPGTIALVSPRQGVQVEFDVAAGRARRFSGWVPLDMVTIVDDPKRVRDGVEVLTIASELKSRAKNLGLKSSSNQVLPDVDRNQGPPDTLAPLSPKPPLPPSFLEQCKSFTDEMVLAVWGEIRDRIPKSELVKVLEQRKKEPVFAVGTRVYLTGELKNQKCEILESQYKTYTSGYSLWKYRCSIGPNEWRGESHFSFSPHPDYPNEE